jgi:hypothetical protein
MLWTRTFVYKGVSLREFLGSLPHQKVMARVKEIRSSAGQATFCSLFRKLTYRWKQSIPYPQNSRWIDGFHAFRSNPGQLVSPATWQWIGSALTFWTSKLRFLCSPWKLCSCNSPHPCCGVPRFGFHKLNSRVPSHPITHFRQAKVAVSKMDSFSPTGPTSHRMWNLWLRYRYL